MNMGGNEELPLRTRIGESAFFL